MITQRLGSQGEPMEYWQFTVNTEATAAGEKTTGIPFNLFNQPGISLEVDWGDGTTSTLTSADYAVNDSRASVHEYATPGIYTVSIGSSKWKKLYILAINSANTISSINNAVAPLYWWRRSLVSLDNSIPMVKGENRYSSPTSVSSLTQTSNSFVFCFFSCSSLTAIPAGLFDNNTQVTDFSGCFFSCSSLAAIPTGLFDNNTAVTNFGSCFYGCSSLTVIPTGLFSNNTAVTDFGGCFRFCPSLSDISLVIGSTLVSQASNFVTIRTGTTRTISVPAGSTTETTFNGIASSLGLTIIGV